MIGAYHRCAAAVIERAGSVPPILTLSPLPERIVILTAGVNCKWVLYPTPRAVKYGAADSVVRMVNGLFPSSVNVLIRKAEVDGVASCERQYHI